VARISINLPDEQASRLSTLATVRATTPEALLTAMARGLLADAAALEAWIAEGEADTAAGRTAPFDQVMVELDAIIARAKAAED